MRPEDETNTLIQLLDRVERAKSEMLSEMLQQRHLFSDILEFTLQYNSFMFISHRMRRIAGNGDSRMITGRIPNGGMPQEVVDHVSGEYVKHTALVLRAYAAFVVGRSEVVIERLAKAARNGGGASVGAALKYLRSDPIRRLRNALAHGKFMMSSNLFKYEDGGKEFAIDFNLLERACAACEAILLNVFAASVEGSEIR